MKHSIRKSIAIGILLTVSSSINAQTAPPLIADSLQAILDASLPATFGKPGAVMGVYVPGKWSWYGASGNAIAGITAGQPVSLATPSTRFRVGSITKTMVATCILMLEQQGKLSIEDPIDKYLRHTLIYDTLMPSDTIRLRHLLNHTSGIPNSADNTSCQMNVLNNPLGSHSLEEAVYCGASQGEIFPAGFAWAYSNTNYSILAMIIQNITGQSCADYIRQHIIIPLNLLNTEIPVTNQIVNPHMGCYWNISSWIDLTIINPTTYTGWADVVSTTEDLMSFHRALLNGLLINSAELAKMKTIDPASFDYGLGLDFYKISGKDYYGHYGEVANTSGMFFADIHSTIAPNGYYIAYNYNTQGVDMQNLTDVPVFALLNSSLSGVDEMNTSAIHLSIFPNPVNDICTVQIDSKEKCSSLKLTDLQGRVLYSSGLSSGSGQVKLDLTGFSKGIYLLNVSGNNSGRTEKLVVE